MDGVRDRAIWPARQEQRAHGGYPAHRGAVRDAFEQGAGSGEVARGVLRLLGRIACDPSESLIAPHGLLALFLARSKMRRYSRLSAFRSALISSMRLCSSGVKWVRQSVIQRPF